MSSLSPLSALAPNFEAAIRDAGSKRAEFRLAAARSLGWASEEERDRAADALAPLFDDELAPVREAALEAAAELSLPRFLTPASRLVVDDPHSGVRHAAACLLGSVGGGEAHDRLVEASEDARPDVRFSAIVGLGLLADPVDAGVFVARLADEDAEVRAISADALGELGARDASDAIALLLEDSSPEPSRSAALALARLGDARAIPRLRQLVGERDWALDALVALGDLRADEAREDLAYLAGRFFGSLILKAAASASLHQLGDPRGAEGLRSVLRALRPDGRSYAVERVGQLGIASLVGELASLARRSRGVDPVVLARALSRLAEQSEAAREALAQLREQGGPRGEAVRQALSAGREELR